MKNRGLGFLVGLLGFSATHAVLVIEWSDWFGGAHAPWFLNSGRAVGFTVAALFVISTIGGAIGLPGTAILAGAVTGMIAGLIYIGGSTIFPIVLVYGGLFLAFACLLGGWIGKELAGLARPRADS